MEIQQNNIFAVRLQPVQLATLARLARETDRSKGAIIRRLLDLAEVLPEARQLLGDPDPKREVQHEPN